MGPEILDMAIERDRADLVRLIDADYSRSVSAVLLASVENCLPDKIRRLVECGINLTEYMYLIHVAIECGSPEMVRPLVAMRVDIEERRNGATPLFTAVREHADGAVAELLACGADPEAFDAYDYTPLMVGLSAAWACG